MYGDKYGGGRRIVEDRRRDRINNWIAWIAVAVFAVLVVGLIILAVLPDA